MSEAQICVAQRVVMVGVGPRAILSAAVASVPELADDEFGGDLLAR